ncbi:structural maintenance of chromosomes protein 2-1-like isoform X2 [Gossypium australe]|uniref:Structural maintenance of chromosomes protein 2-1-like isoform X2 n=1 Tax=Gossypium australe TaxID=47621 RepID=A0A5B6UHX2_9ROSI|nr:structural maintenance of chromosomes protein 2-1-like isoform X2 [Gossypium australe]
MKVLFRGISLTTHNFLHSYTRTSQNPVHSFTPLAASTRSRLRLYSSKSDSPVEKKPDPVIESASVAEANVEDVALPVVDMSDKDDEKGKSSQVAMKLVYPRVHPRVHQTAMKLVGKENAKLALSLVGYDEELESAMEYVFGATFVCKTTDAAKEACPSDCFHMWFFKQCETIHYYLIWLELMSKFYLYLSPKNNINCQFMYGFFSFQLNVLQVAFNREISTRSVTLEGDIFQTSGLLTGGIRRSSEEIADLQPLQKMFMHLKAQLELKMHDLSLFQNRAEKNEHLKLAEMIKNIEQELEVAN